MSKYMLVRDIFTEDTDFKVPEAYNQEFEVGVWGGGGAGAFHSDEGGIVMGAGGGSGYMNTGTLTLNAGESVYIGIGNGGKGCSGIGNAAFENAHQGNNGEESFFGNYLKAAGGMGANGDIGGIGGCNGGTPGIDSEGNFGGYGVMQEINGIMYMSGGGGSSLGGKGTGGSANYAAGDAGTSGGGAGCLVTSVDNAGVHMKTGDGGRGVVTVKYYRKLGD